MFTPYKEYEAKMQLKHLELVKWALGLIKEYINIESKQYSSANRFKDRVETTFYINYKEVLLDAISDKELISAGWYGEVIDISDDQVKLVLRGVSNES